MNAIETLIPLYLTAHECPQKLARNTHQALALMIYDDVQARKLNLENFMYFQQWANDECYCRHTAVKIALRLRKYFRLREEHKQYKIEHSHFWRRVRLSFVLYNLSHRRVYVDDVLDYACYLFINTKCGDKDGFLAFLQTVYQNPALYFNHKNPNKE